MTSQKQPTYIYNHAVFHAPPRCVCRRCGRAVYRGKTDTSRILVRMTRRVVFNEHLHAGHRLPRPAVRRAVTTNHLYGAMRRHRSQYHVCGPFPTSFQRHHTSAFATSGQLLTAGKCAGRLRLGPFKSRRASPAPPTCTYHPVLSYTRTVADIHAVRVARANRSYEKADAAGCTQ